MVSAYFWDKDGPYSWIILAAIALSRFVGISFALTTLGVFADTYPEHFGEEQAKTNVIGSTLLGIFLFSVPFNSLLMKVIGVRYTAAIGASLTIIGIIPSAFATEIWHLVLSYSIMTCYGMSMTVTSTLGIVRHYFEKRRGAAFASIAVGAGLAGVVNPVILSSMLTKFGYKYTMLYISPMFLLNIVPPALFKEQLPSEKRESSWTLLNSYVKAFRRFVTPFFLLNAFFSYGAQLSVLVLLFTHISDTVDNHTAVISYTIYGLSGLGSSLCLILAFLRFRLNSFILQICFNSLCALGCFMVASLPVAGVTYASCVLLGMSHAGVLAVKGALCIHLYPSEAIEYAYTLSEAIAGIGSFIFPYAAGYLQRAYGTSSGLYLLGTAGLVGCLLLVFSALIRRKLWKMPRTKETYLSLALLDGIGAVSTLVKLVGQPTLAPNKGSVEKQRNKPNQPDESGELQTQTDFIVADDGYATCSAN